MLWLTDTIKRAPVTSMEEDIEAGGEASAAAKQPQQQELQQMRENGQGQQTVQGEEEHGRSQGQRRGAQPASIHGSTAAVFVL